jgi:chaperonin GroEL
MNREILDKKTSIELLLKGAKLASDFIMQTMGPGGKFVGFSAQDSTKFRVTKDGATAAKMIKHIKHPVENAGCAMIVEASQQMADVVGDGSTTVVAILISLITESCNLLNSGYSSNNIQKALKQLSEKSEEIIKQITEVIDPNNNSIQKIAHIASNGDSKVSEILSELFTKLGHDGVIVVEDSKTGEDTFNIKDGFFFDKGPAAISFFKPEEQKRMKCEMENPYVMVINEKMNSLQAYLKFFNSFSSTGKPLVIVADDFDTDVLNILMFNKAKGLFNVMCIKAPGFGDRKQDFLSDLAIITGASTVGDGADVTPSNLEIAHLGKAKKAIVFRDNTTIIGGEGDATKITTRIESINTMIESSASNYDKEKLQERAARLSKGIGVFLVGVEKSTAVDIEERKQRIEDAIHACRNALKSGFVPGAGNEFLWIANEINKIAGEDEVTRILKILTSKALVIITKQIVNNTEKASADVIINEVQKAIREGKWKLGFNGYTGEVSDLIEAGIINPSAVAIKAIKIATSICDKFINTGSFIYELEETNKDKGMPEGLY